MDPYQIEREYRKRQITWQLPLYVVLITALAFACRWLYGQVQSANIERFRPQFECAAKGADAAWSYRKQHGVWPRYIDFSASPEELSSTPSDGRFRIDGPDLTVWLDPDGGVRFQGHGLGAKERAVSADELHQVLLNDPPKTPCVLDVTGS